MIYLKINYNQFRTSQKKEAGNFMDLKQIEYIIKIAEENNITHAAEKLFITQSALNQQLLKLEKELGTPLFYRSRTDWHPTPAGEIYLETARKILLLKKEAYNKIHDLCEIEKGKLSIGFTPGRGIAMFTHVYPPFHALYPNIEMIPNELSVHDQFPLLQAGQLDIGFMTLLKKQRKTGFEYLPFSSEELFLVVPTSLAEILGDKLISSQDFGTDSHSIPIANLAVLKEEPFVLTHKTSTIRELVDSIFKESGFAPNVLFETENNHAIISMVRSKICCGIVPEYYVDPTEPELTYYALPGHPNWEIVATYKKGHYLTKAARALLSLVEEYYN